jgi:threonine dehydratase
MKIFRTTSKKRVIVSSGVGGVVGLIAWLLFRLYLHGVAYESTQPDPERDAAMQTAAQALGDDTTRSPTSQTTADATQEMRPQ